MPPELILHADWGSDPKKRWMCAALLEGDRYHVRSPEPVGDLQTFWDRVRVRAGGGSTLIGFDFPIGLPIAFAKPAGITRFKDWLPLFGKGNWIDFYRLAKTPAEISLRRPFYPLRPGGTKQHYLVEGLGVTSMHDLLRRCERPTEIRGAASSLFWTLGGKQVGRAAIIGWRDLLGPAISDPGLDLKLWPFDGRLIELVAHETIVVSETYPAEACTHLGLQPPGRLWSKTSQAGRKAQAEKLLEWAKKREVRIGGSLIETIEDGFGDRKSAEDPFDALLGLLSMVDVSLGMREEGMPHDYDLRVVEGWILGQKP